MSEYTLKKIKKIKGQIEVVTGLRIGASQETMEIGGMDNPIIRNPANGEPYIPGSSIKGKMRSLMEWQLGKVSGGEVFQEKDSEKAKSCPITRVFGHSASRDLRIGPTRLVVRDAFLCSEDRKKFQEGDRPIVEVKYENSINRLTSEATPRSMERVVPGTKFDFELIFRVIQLENDPVNDEDLFDETVLRGLRLLELNYLGSAGSRGCGQIRFTNLTDENNQPVDLTKVAI